MDGERSWTLNPLVSATPMASGMVLLDAATGDCFELNRIGAEVWNAMKEGAQKDQFVAEIAGKYNVAVEQVSEDVNRLLDEMIARGILRMTSTR